MIVLDASVAFEMLVRTDIGEAVTSRLLDTESSVHAPHLIDVEVAHVLRARVAARLLDARRAEQALEDLRMLDAMRHPHHDLLARVWQLRHDLTPYDAVYVALAEALNAPLVTVDARLARSSGHSATIELVHA